MKKILVTGANGQLGSKIQEKIAKKDASEAEWIFLTRSELDITDRNEIERVLSEHKPDIVVNCAAYTNVNGAESNEEEAFEVNAYGAKKLAEVCKDYDIFLVHISTDFVFSGDGINTPIPADYITFKYNAINAYGRSKHWGEFYIQQSGCRYIIIRTSWLYSDGAKDNNFVNSIVNRLLSPSDCSDVNVVVSEIGSPTYAGDLADFILLVTELDYEKKQGTYHYCNNGVISRYDFAKAIYEILLELEVIDGKKDIMPTFKFDTKVKRPAYSALDSTKACQNFAVSIPYWKDSLYDALINLMRNEGYIQ